MPGEDAIIRFKTYTISDTIVRPANTTAYASGDAVSDVTTNDPHTFTIPDKALITPGPVTGAIDSLIILTDKASAAPTLELYLFATTITETADNAAWSLSDTDMLNLIGIIDIASTDWKDGAACAVASKSNTGIAFTLKNDGASTPYAIIGQLVTRAVYTPASDEEITIKLVLSLD